MGSFQVVWRLQFPMWKINLHIKCPQMNKYLFSLFRCIQLLAGLTKDYFCEEYVHEYKDKD